MRYRARFVLPICSPPLRDGFVEISDGHITAVGGSSPLGAPPDAPHGEQDLGSVVLMPGLVNAHTHLELSYLRGAVPAASEFVTWIRGIMGARRQRPDARSPEIMDGLDAGIAEAIATGTAVVGDISNTLVPLARLADSALAGVVFYEILRFNTPDPAAVVREAVTAIQPFVSSGDVRASLAAHAPYSVAPGIFRAMRQAMDADPALSPCSIHLAESRAEVEFLAQGSGPWRQLLEDVGSWDPAWTAPATSPVQYVDDHGLLDRRMLVVHGVQMTVDDLARVAASGATLVACPRSNVHTGAGTPPIERFYASGARVAVGTDSLASTEDLNVFAELAAMHRLAPTVPAARLLDSATRVGAEALGYHGQFGILAPGARARVLAVQVPAGVDDVEEYLVSGVTPDQLSWLA